MLYEIRGVCHHCATEYKVIISDEESHGKCPECGEKPIRFKIFKGMIYVVNNPNQSGVKVGRTKDINQRIKQLSNSGVPGKFSLVALFPSDNPETDEKKAHDKLKRYILDKEHFEIDPIEAVLKVRTALNRREPIFNNKRMKQQFIERLEENRMKMKKRLGTK